MPGPLQTYATYVRKVETDIDSKLRTRKCPNTIKSPWIVGNMPLRTSFWLNCRRVAGTELENRHDRSPMTAFYFVGRTPVARVYIQAAPQERSVFWLSKFAFLARIVCIQVTQQTSKHELMRRCIARQNLHHNACKHDERTALDSLQRSN